MQTIIFTLRNTIDYHSFININLINPKPRLTKYTLIAVPHLYPKTSSHAALQQHRKTQGPFVSQSSTHRKLLANSLTPKTPKLAPLFTPI